MSPSMVTRCQLLSRRTLPRLRYRHGPDTVTQHFQAGLEPVQVEESSMESSMEKWNVVGEEAVDKEDVEIKLGEEGVGMQKQKDKEESQPEPNKTLRDVFKTKSGRSINFI